MRWHLPVLSLEHLATVSTDGWEQNRTCWLYTVLKIRNLVLLFSLTLDIMKLCRIVIRCTDRSALASKMYIRVVY